jgi:hypothetical protein
MHAAFSSRTERWGIAVYGYGVRGLAMLGVPGMEPGTLRDEKIWSPARMSLHALDYLAANFAAPKTGHVYFAHILLPHFPFVLDRDCKRRPPREWRWPLWVWEATVAGRRLDGIYAAYGEQLRCTHSHVMRLIDTMTKSVAGPETVFVIHGDHGPRIFKKIGHVDRANETEAILSDGLDTFFAIKAAGLPPGINERSESLPVRFQEILKNYLPSEKRN